MQTDGGSSTPPAGHGPLPVHGCTPYHPNNSTYANFSKWTHVNLLIMINRKCFAKRRKLERQSYNN